MALDGLSICTTGLEKHVNLMVRASVLKLGAIYIDSLDDEADILLVGRVGTEKYREALRRPREIRCLDPSWIFECDAQDTKISMSKFNVDIFKGLTICVTQIGEEEKKKIKKLVEARGATFSANMHKESCTHLIARDSNSPTSSKYNKAREWGSIKICLKAWIDDCVLRERWLPEENYDPDVVQNESFHSVEKNIEKQIQSDDLIFDELPEIGAIRNTDILQNDIFFIDGFTSVHRDYCIQLVLRGGGRICHYLSPKVTKVLLGDIVDDKLNDSLRSLKANSLLQLVTVEWLSNTLVTQKSFLMANRGFKRAKRQISDDNMETKCDAPSTRVPVYYQTTGMASRIRDREMERKAEREQESQFVTWNE
jgi:hypothetical protein